MPQLGETVTEGTITRWLKQVGDTIAVDDLLYEVSTDKVDTEVPSAHAGVLRQILVPEGETVAIGTPLAVIADSADEEVAEAAAPAPAPAPAPSPAEVVQQRTEKGLPVTKIAASGNGRPSSGGEHGFLSPVVRALLAGHGLEPGDVVGSGRDGRITRSDVLAAAANRRAAAPAATPVAPGWAPTPSGATIAYP